MFLIVLLAQLCSSLQDDDLGAGFILVILGQIVNIFEYEDFNIHQVIGNPSRVKVQLQGNGF